MANRHTLHISKLDSFREWLVKDGWEIEEPKGIYEVLRARKAGRKNPLIVYTKADAKEHLSIMDMDSGVLGAYIRDCKKPKTNADLMRAMSDEELAKENIYFVSALNAREGLHYTGLDGHYYRTAEEVVEANMKWLQSEVEE